MEEAFVNREACCIKECQAYLLESFNDGQDHVWVLAVVDKIYPLVDDKKIKAFLLREVQEDGSASDRPFSCFFMEDFAMRAEREVRLGDALCLYRPSVFVWKESVVCPELMDFRAVLQPGGQARVLRFSLMRRGGCSDCQAACPGPSAAAAAAASLRLLHGNQKTAGQTATATSAAPDVASADSPPTATASSAIPGDQPLPPPPPQRSPASRSTRPAAGAVGPTQKRRGRSRKQKSASPENTVQATTNQEPPASPTAEPPEAHIVNSPPAEASAAEPARPAEPTEVAEPLATSPSGTVPTDSHAAGAHPTAAPAADAEVMDASQDSSLDVAADFMLRVPVSEPSNAYTLLADIGRNDPHLRQRPNLMGVIVSVPKQPRPTSRSYMVMVVIKDPSCRAQDAPRGDFVVFGFVSSPADLPAVGPNHGLQVGNVLRARHVKVESRAGKLDGRVFRGSSLTVFSGGVDDSQTPLGAASPPPHVSDAERARLRWLREWWMVERHHQERLAGTVDAKLSDVARPGLYNLQCKIQALEEVGGELFVRVQDGTRCSIPCFEPRPGDATDPDNPSSPAEPETQIFREQPDCVSIRVADRRCAEALRNQRAGSVRFLQLLRVRVSDELSQQETYTTGLAFALEREDEPLVLPLGTTTDEALAIRERLEDVMVQPRQGPGDGGEPPTAPPPPPPPAPPTAPPPPPAPPTAPPHPPAPPTVPPPPPPPAPAEDQPRLTAGADYQDSRPDRRAACREEPISGDPTAALDTAGQPVADSGPGQAAALASRLAPVVVGSIFTEVELGTECGEQRPQCSGGQPLPLVPGSRTCVEKTWGGRATTEERAERHQATETSSSQESSWHPVQRESLEISETPPDLNLASQPTPQPAAGSSQASSGTAEGFTTAPQSPAPTAVSSAPAAPTSPAAAVSPASVAVSPAPAARTSPGAAVSQAPAAVSPAPAARTSPGAAVSSAPAAVSQAPAARTSPGAAVSQAPAAVSPAPAARTSPGAAVSQAPAAVSPAPAARTSPGAAVSQAPAAVSPAPAARTSPGAAVSQALAAVSPPPGPSAAVTDEALRFVPFKELSDQPAGRPFRTRCLLRGGAAWPADGDPRPLLTATCLQRGCRTQYRAAAMPAIKLNLNLEPAYMCPRCHAEMLLSLALPFELHSISSDNADGSSGGNDGVGSSSVGTQTLEALAVGEPAELLFAAVVRVGSLAAVRRRLAAVSAALRVGVSGEVGLLPLPEPDRRYMIVDTVLDGMPEQE